MRKCQVVYKKWSIEEKKYEIEKTEEGLFHTWKQAGDSENGMGAIGLVELDDGRMIEADPESIKFDVPDKKEKRELGCYVFRGSPDKVERLVSNFLLESDVSRIFKIMQSECYIDSDVKSITITILYYK